MKIRGVRISKTSAVSIIAALLVAGVGTFALLNRTSAQPPVVNAVQNTQSEYVLYIGKKGTTALTQLKETAKKVVTKKSSYGDYVEAIGERVGGADGKYWTFYVDGKMASVGAGTYVSKGGEKIEWKFEKAQ